MNREIILRKAQQNDAVAFAELVEISAPLFLPTLLGHKFRTIIQHLFSEPGNLFSFQHAHFAEINRHKAGMILGYDWLAKKREDLRTGFLFLKYMRWEFLKRLILFLTSNNATGGVARREYYISNVAVYPEFRGVGVATSLMSEAEIEAREKHAKRIVLDVETENQKAIALYRKLGYTIAKESAAKLHGTVFHFYRMFKELT